MEGIETCTRRNWLLKRSPTRPGDCDRQLRRSSSCAGVSDGSHDLEQTVLGTSAGALATCMNCATSLSPRTVSNGVNQTMHESGFWKCSPPDALRCDDASSRVAPQGGTTACNQCIDSRVCRLERLFRSGNLCGLSGLIQICSHLLQDESIAMVGANPIVVHAEPRRDE